MVAAMRCRRGEVCGGDVNGRAALSKMVGGVSQANTRRSLVCPAIEGGGLAEECGWCPF